MTNQAIPDPNSLIVGSGGRSAPFKEHGDAVDGIIVSSRTRQQTDIDGKPKFYEDTGNPMWEVVVTLATELPPEDDEDDGVRIIYVKGQMMKALGIATAKAGAKDGIANGGRVYVRFTSTAEPIKKGYSGAKQYFVKYQAPVAVITIPADDGQLEYAPIDPDDLPF